MQLAMTIGTDNLDQLDSMYNPTPQDVLRGIPGISSRNYKRVMHNVKDLKTLSEMSKQKLAVVLGGDEVCARMVYDFFRNDPNK